MADAASWRTTLSYKKPNIDKIENILYYLKVDF